MRGSTGIVGGGILGLTAAYRLAQRGIGVTVFERSHDLGGLVGSFDFAGAPADRFYHVILPTDDRVLRLAEELGLGEQFDFRPTRVGFFDADRLFSMSTVREFLTFPLLPPQDRVRLAAFVLRCRRITDCTELDDTPLLEWLERLCGRRTLERLWLPLLDSKFDGAYEDLPATYLWGRTRRMSSTRDAAGRELMGWLRGGYQRLIDALVERIRALGGEVHAGAEVEAIDVDGLGPSIRLRGVAQRFDQVVCTLMPVQAARLLPSAVTHAVPDHCRYLGVVCTLLRLDRSLSPYYTLNITDRRIPLTTVVETTHVVDPGHAGGHLVYAAKYVDPGHPDLSRPVAEVESDYLGHIRRIFPLLEDQSIQAVVCQRARAVEPVHTLGGARRIPDMFPAPGLALASTAHVYPEIVNGQAVIGVADRLVAGLVERLPEAHLVAA